MTCEQNLERIKTNTENTILVLAEIVTILDEIKTNSKVTSDVMKVLYKQLMGVDYA